MDVRGPSRRVVSSSLRYFSECFKVEDSVRRVSISFVRLARCSGEEEVVVVVSDGSGSGWLAW